MGANRLEVERLEVMRGGRWRFVEHAEDGSFGFEGRFREVAPPSRLVMTFEFDGMLSAGMETGLQQSYAALDALLARIA